MDKEKRLEKRSADKTRSLELPNVTVGLPLITVFPIRRADLQIEEDRGRKIEEGRSREEDRGKVEGRSRKIKERSRKIEEITCSFVNPFGPGFAFRS